MKEIEKEFYNDADNENLSYFPSLATNSYESIERLFPIYEKTKDFLFILSQAARIDNNKLEDFLNEINKDQVLNYNSGKDYIQFIINNAKVITEINDALKDLERFPVGAERNSVVAEMELLLKWFTLEHINAEFHYKKYKGRY